MMAASGIHHVALTVNDWEQAKDFYSKLFDALGAKPVIDVQGPPHRDPDGHMMAFAGDGFMATLWEAQQEFRKNRFQLYNVGLHHVAFAAPSREEVDRLHDTLREMKAEVLDPPQEYPYAPGYYAVYFADPEGMKLEYAHIP